MKRTFFSRFISAMISVALAVAIGVGTTSCGGEIRTWLSYDLSGDPSNLDPQCATGDSAYTVINNIFEGLMTADEQGNLVCGLAEKYTVSEDKLTYRFTLRDGLKWSDGEHAVTAHDFVFAFQRLFDPKTRSASASSFYCIKNSQNVAEGRADISSLGVYAPSDTELVFELEYPNSMFLQLLTTAPAMPCNQEFFEQTEGTYGLDSSSLISTGPYYLKSWVEDEESYIKLGKNDSYYSADQVNLTSLTLYTNTEDEEVIDRFIKGDTQVYAYSGKTDRELQKNIDDYQSSVSQNVLWGLALNPANEYLQNTSLRLALAHCFDRARYAEVLPDYLTAADAMVPPEVTLDGENYRENSQEVKAPGYDPELAKTEYAQALAQLQTAELNNLKVLIPNDTGIDHLEYFNYISQSFQREFNLFLSVEEVSSDDLEDRMEQGDYQIAVIPLESNYDSPAAVLNRFSSHSQTNRMDYQNASFDNALNAALTESNPQMVLENYQLAEQILLNDAVLLPMYYESNYLLFDSDADGVMKNKQNGYLTFRYTCFTE
ncbi:MAG: peptide ABC transporter substrate-binding protein [Massiliimalia sp.]